MACLVSAFLAACGGDNQGRDPILGTEGNVAQRPTVTAVDPAAGAEVVRVNRAAVTATFSEPMSPLTGDASFTLTCAAPCTAPTGTVSLDSAGTKGSFTLDGRLEIGTVYTATVTGARSRATGLALAEPFSWSFTTAQSPTVTAVAPTDNATDVPVNSTVITAQFNEAVQALTADEFTITCEAPCTDANGVVSMNAQGNIATFSVTNPDTLDPLTRYTATILSATSSATGETLEEPFVWGFTTGEIPDTTKPTVTVTDPATGAPDPTTEVSIDTAIRATFSEDMNPTTITDATFSVSCEAPCEAPSGSVSYGVDSRTAVFTPSNDLDSDTLYTVTVDSAVTDLAGNPLSGNQGEAGETSDYVWSFTTTRFPTVTAVAPTNNATDVPVNATVITAQFSEPVEPLMDSEFTVTCEDPCTDASGVVSMNAQGTVATFTVTDPDALEPLTLYTATIVSATSSAIGETLQEPFVWRFTTGETPDTANPTVTSTVPATGDPDPTAGVRTDTAITATFSEAMDPTTITDASFTLSCASPCAPPSGAVSYNVNSQTVAFTAEDDLAFDTTYTVTVDRAVTDLAGNTLSGNQGQAGETSDYIWSFTTVRPPTVTAVAPTDDATDVPVNATTVTAQFSEPVNALTDDDFTLTCEAPCSNANGVVSMSANGTIATFTVTDPDTLEALTLYTATVVNATSSATGETLQESFVWNFTTGENADTTKPTVTSTEPATSDPGPTLGVPSNTAITATFSEAMAPTTITDATFTLSCASPCDPPSGAVSYDVDSRTATFAPANGLAFATTYTVTVDSAVTDLAGNPLSGNQGQAGETSDYVWSFTTGAVLDTTKPTVTATEPVTGDPGPTTEVFVDTAISATFSEDMDPTTITDANFTVSCASPCVAPFGTILYDVDSQTAAFTLGDDLEFDTTYTVTVAREVTDLSGNQLAGNQGPAGETSDYIWSFRTIIPPPTVTAVAPVNNATGVPVNNTVITAQFSEPVDALADGDFTVTCEDPCTDANGELSMNAAGTIATFTVTDPDALEELTRYTATIVTASSSANGQTLQQPFVWRFTTGVIPDTTKPRVILTEPPTTDPGPTMVPTNTAITATFSEDMAPLTITDENFTLTCEAPCLSPAGAVSYVVGSRAAVFKPEDELESGTTYTAIVDSSVTDLAGNRLSGNQGQAGEISNYIWTFTTDVALPADDLSVLSTEPLADGTLLVCPDESLNAKSSVSATFEVPSALRLDPVTVNSLTFRIVEHDTPSNSVIADSVVLDVDTGTIVTFTPQEQLTAGVTYRATLKGGQNGVKDLAVPANEMSEDFVWTFAAVAADPDDCDNPPVSLNTAAPFGIFGGSAGMTNDGLLTIINGDIGTTAASTSVTGFVSESGCEYTITPLNRGQVNGRIYTAPPQPQTPPTPDPACDEDGSSVTEQIAILARSDANDAFIALSPAALPGGQTPSGDGENLGGQTLAPGIYQAPGGAFLIEGSDLTLDGQGNQNSIWVFQMASTLSVGEAAVPRSVTLINGAQAKNVFWQVGSAATINPSGGGFMKGTIIAAEGVSISTTGNNTPELIVTLDGRALSLGASVTVTNTIINVPAP